MSHTETPADDEDVQFDERSFDDAETRSDEMRDALSEWVDDLAEQTDDTLDSDEFQEWLDVQSQFHDYSARNTLLIKLQCPEATTVAGYHTWQSEFDRHVQEGESAIWIWAPIITTRCPECENSPSYHERHDCEYDETPPEEWGEGLVGFKPTAVFDVSQTEGEPLPELDTEAHGDATGLVDTLLEAGERLGVDVSVVEPDAWDHGSASGICKPNGPGRDRPLVEVQDRSNDADLACTLIHEYAHALLHVGADDGDDEATHEVEAEAVAYVVSRHFGLDASNSTFYLAAWDDDAPETIRERLELIASSSEKLIEIVNR